MPGTERKLSVCGCRHASADVHTQEGGRAETQDGEKDAVFAVPGLCVLLKERCGGESI